VQSAIGAEHASGIDLEITESLVLDDPQVGVGKLAELRAAGMRIYMDDFGTGYSNLAQIAALPLDALKIDRVFVARMLDSTEATAIVSTSVSLARALSIDVVAEGVETEEQLAELRRLGCDGAQGYLFAAPMCAADFEALLAAGPVAMLDPAPTGA